jgi:predicted RNase H-like HicB family nuclease
MIFIAVVHKDPDSAFGISFPDLPGCFSSAESGHP